MNANVHHWIVDCVCKLTENANNLHVFTHGEISIHENNILPSCIYYLYCLFFFFVLLRCRKVFLARYTDFVILVLLTLSHFLTS